MWPPGADFIEKLGMRSRQRHEGRCPEKILLSDYTEHIAEAGSHNRLETESRPYSALDNARGAPSVFFNKLRPSRTLKPLSACAVRGLALTRVGIVIPKDFATEVASG